MQKSKIENPLARNNVYSIIMAGGVGSRFWPKSNQEMPKQFLDMLGTGQSLIQQTWERTKRFCPKENIFIVTNKAYKDIVKEQIPQASEEQILLEPGRKNTAPCIAYATYKIYKLNPEANIIVAPADHLILKEEKFTSLIDEAVEFVQQNNALLTIGIRPTRPDTGYGYIEFNEDSVEGYENIHRVNAFTEKPTHPIAEKFIKQGNYFWNAGIFVWNIKTILKEFETHLPKMNKLFKSGKTHYNTNEEENFINDIYDSCKSISIDYGIMEKSEHVYVIKADIGWTDLGTWNSLYNELPHDENGNALLGKHFDLDESTQNCIINIPDKKIIALKGLKDFIVVDTEDALLIYPRKDEQEIKKLVNRIKVNKHNGFA